MNDIQIYNKAKTRVFAHLIFYFIFLCAYDVATYYVLSLDFFQGHSFSYSYVGIALAQILIFVIAFGLLATGKKWTRIIYWTAFAANLGLFYIPIKALLGDLSQFLMYGGCLAMMGIEVMILVRIGLYFYQNPYCRIYYDHILSEELEQKLMAQSVNERKLNIQETATASINNEPYEEEELEEEIKIKAPLTYPQMALRLGICVYGELIVFPILCTIFSNFFASYDLQQVFATREMFMLCIFSAFIWTIPIFYLYYDQDRSKMIVWICIAVEIALMIWTGFNLKNLYASDLYPMRAIILFIILDLIRYVILFFFIKPVLTTPHHSEKID